MWAGALLGTGRNSHGRTASISAELKPQPKRRANSRQSGRQEKLASCSVRGRRQLGREERVPSPVRSRLVPALCWVSATCNEIGR